jgi:geranylgeranyl pyrophosphate synthase
MNAGDLTKKALEIVFSSGKPALSAACQKILTNQYDNDKIKDTLHFYAQSVMPNVLPIFPALIILSSKAVGGNEKNAQAVAAAMMLITSSGDIHDDIVDNSKAKFGNKTLFGKYGRDLTLLAGDLLLMQGITELQKECSVLSEHQQNLVSELILKGMVNIVKAEALEPQLWQKNAVTPDEFFEVINLKAGVAELHCRLGGIIAGADKCAMESLGQFGRTVGVLSTLKEEFVDLSNPAELQHRLKRELPPYPMLYAMQNPAVKAKVQACKNKTNTPAVVLSSLELRKLVADFRVMGEKELAKNPLLKGNDAAAKLAVLLEALAVELPLV